MISGEQALTNPGAFMIKQYYQQLFSLSLLVPEKNATKR
jgi:hypothetical protein